MTSTFEREDPRLDTEGYPEPCGYRVLVRLPPVVTRIGSIILTEQAQDPQRHLAQTAQVIAVGPDAYRERGDGRGGQCYFPSGAWAKVGDYISFSKYAGTRYLIREREVRLINDDEVQAILSDPSALKSAS